MVKQTKNDYSIKKNNSKNVYFVNEKMNAKIFQLSN